VACLVELVNSGGDGADLVRGHAADLEDTVEDLSVVELSTASSVDLGLEQIGRGKP
jgi:hypothetical protein